MCGIAGVLRLRGGGVEPAVLRAMADSIAHRGPDDEGYHVDGPLGFAFRRLAIVDLAGGHQPLVSADGQVAAVVNGEIYNHRQLREQLAARGHRFTSAVDSEVVLHGYLEWGDEVLTRLNGIFAFAVWDARRQRLLLARDRAGVKFLYYRLNDRELVFGSELRAVITACGRPPVDPTAVNLFLRYRYTPSPLTVYTGVGKIPAGHKLVVEDGRTTVSDYWSYDPAPRDHARDPKAAEEELLRRYAEAVRRQLMADVPVGLLLSGGVDSALLLALMAQHGQQWHTFTVGYGDAYPHDELAAAAQTARRFGARHAEVRLDRAGFEAGVCAVVDILEEPIATASMVALYHVCRRAAQDVTVALIGQGPDELLGGYTRHLGVHYGPLWRALPGPVRAAGRRLLGLAPRMEAIHRGLHSLDVPNRLSRYQQILSLLPGARVDGLFQAGVLPPNAGDRILECWSGAAEQVIRGDELSGFQYLEVRSTLPDELLLAADKLSMHHSLELRVPYLDHEIIEYAGRLPASLKVRWGARKWLHKRLCRSYLPAEIVNRPKRAFASDVVDRWYRDSLSGMIADTLLPPDALLYQILRRDRVWGLIEDHRRGHRDHHKIIYSLVVLESWLRRTAAPLA